MNKLDVQDLELRWWINVLEPSQVLNINANDEDRAGLWNRDVARCTLAIQGNWKNCHVVNCFILAIQGIYLFFRKVIEYLPSFLRMEVMLSMLCVGRIMSILCQRNWPSAREVVCAFRTLQLTGPWLPSKSALNLSYQLWPSLIFTFLPSVCCNS